MVSQGGHIRAKSDLKAKNFTKLSIIKEWEKEMKIITLGGKHDFLFYSLPLDETVQ